MKQIKMAKEFFEKSGMQKFTCCICGCDFYDWTGNNPAPVVTDEEAVCCDACNLRFVVPARSKAV